MKGLKLPSVVLTDVKVAGGVAEQKMKKIPYALPWWVYLVAALILILIALIGFLVFR